MNLIWRFIYVFLFSRFQKPAHILSQCRTSFFVLPTDVDLLFHMNNGRYFSLLDIARINFMIRCKAFNKFHQAKVYPVVASEMIRFKKSLNLFQAFNITTCILGWDTKFFFILHEFKVKNKLYAAALIRTCFLRKAGHIVNTEEILSLLDLSQPSQALPQWINQWQAAEQQFMQSMN